VVGACAQIADWWHTCCPSEAALKPGNPLLPFWISYFPTLF
jgi:hypothetical protein